MLDYLLWSYKQAKHGGFLKIEIQCKIVNSTHCPLAVLLESFQLQSADITDTQKLE